MFKKVSTIIITTLFLVVPFLTYAQYESSTVILNPYGDDYREPKIYGTGYIAPSPTVPTPATIPAKTPVSVPTTNLAQPTVPNSTDLFNTSKSNSSFLGGIFQSKLKLDVSGAGRACLIGGEKSIPWAFINNGVDIDTIEELRATIDQAIEADKRIRRITIKENMLDIYYLQPARIFGIIPINYLYKVSIDTGTFQVSTQKPSWLRFAKHFYGDVTDTLTTNLTHIYSPQNLEYIQKQNIYYKHSFSIAAVSSIWNTIDMYPFANTFWICTIVPYFVLFLLVLGILLGFLFYYWAKRKKDRYIRRFKNGDFARNINGVGKPFPQRELPRMNDDSDDNESLDDYIKSKRFK